VAIPYVVAVPGAWHLRPSDGSAAADSYVRALPFGREIDDAARRHEIDVLLLASVVEAESNFRPDAISPKGALGLMQLMPLHFDEKGEPFDPAQNLDLGARYLESLRQRYDGDLELTLAAYHAGPGTVSRYGGAPPWKETRRYVDRVLTLYREHQANLVEEKPAATL
jgi:soluble lytic murein transglycosylase-like protein